MPPGKQSQLKVSYKPGIEVVELGFDISAFLCFGVSAFPYVPQCLRASILHSTFDNRQSTMGYWVPHHDTARKTVLAKRTHWTLLLNKNEQHWSGASTVTLSLHHGYDPLTIGIA
jgi:hypothetical protein